MVAHYNHNIDQKRIKGPNIFLIFFFAIFFSRLHNKGVYFKVGLRKMMNRRTCKDLNKMITVEYDGNKLDLPPVEGILILNVLR